MSLALTETQKAALSALREHSDRYGFAAFTKPAGVQAGTLYALRHLGLAATQERPTTVVARITEAGREWLATNERRAEA